MNLSHSFKKSKLTIHEQCGNVRIKYDINTVTYCCPCPYFNSCTKKALCKHIQYLFTRILQLEERNLFLLSVPAISDTMLRTDIKELQNGQLNSVCQQFLSETDCDFCMDSLAQSELVHCLNCKWVFHQKCRTKWKGNCPRCQQ